MRFLPLLALLPLPLATAGDLGWHVQVATTSKFAPLEFTAQLMNVTKEKIAFEAEGDRPAIDLILQSGKAPSVRKPLPKEATVSKGPKELIPTQAGWYVTGDLRHAFGRLAPGKYTLRAALGELVSDAAEFEVIDTSLEEAKAKAVAPEGIEFRVKGDGVGVLHNGRKEPIGLWAYGEDQPLSALVTAQQWTGRGFWASPRGYCGTGLVEVTIAPGAEREIALPSFPDGILRIAVACFRGKGEGIEQIEAVTEPFLVDNFKG